jgi:hypothetical protein
MRRSLFSALVAGVLPAGCSSGGTSLPSNPTYAPPAGGPFIEVADGGHAVL